jgi:hypothetical protein
MKDLIWWFDLFPPVLGVAVLALNVMIGVALVIGRLTDTDRKPLTAQEESAIAAKVSQSAERRRLAEWQASHVAENERRRRLLDGAP